jgi:hypothetical protein
MPVDIIPPLEETNSPSWKFGLRELFAVACFVTSVTGNIVILRGMETNDVASSRRYDRQDTETDQRAVGVALRPAAQSLFPMDAREIASGAAERWKPAVALKRRAITINQVHGNGPVKSGQTAKILACFLELQAAHQQDLGASVALRVYYSRVAIQEQLEWIAASGASLEEQRAKQTQLMDRGISTVIDFGTWDRMSIDLMQRSLELQAEDTRLRVLMKSLTGIDDEQSPFALEPLTIERTQIDCEKLVKLACRERMDLIAWRYLQQRVDSESAPSIITLLAGSVAGYGLPLPNLAGIRKLLLHHSSGELLADNLRSELSIMVQIHQEAIRQEVHEKCLKLKLAYDLHQLELQRLDSWKRRLDQLDRLESFGQSQPEEKQAAYAGWRQTQSTEITKRAEAKLAEVALSESVGGLAARCCFREAWLVTGRE